MRVLVVKTSSMGDLIHTLPALTDAEKAHPGIRFDWVAEEGFCEIPKMHPAVDKVIPVAIRRWRREVVSSIANGQITSMVSQLRQKDYDYIIDAQGLIKSAMVTFLAHGVRCGLDYKSCKEPFAALGYQKKVNVPKKLHAIERVRRLFSEVLGYQFDPNEMESGLDTKLFNTAFDRQPYVVFLHGASHPAKLWPKDSWVKLAMLFSQQGYTIYLPWGNEEEKQRAEAIAQTSKNVVILPKMNLNEIACLLNQAKLVIGVDTGLAHLAAALDTPGITLYLGTVPGLTGACGHHQTCLTQVNDKIGNYPASLDVIYHQQITVERVWQAAGTKLNH
ncbi:MAG: lipopolysaccharide heptosyltransferase I [Methylococcaceae bacterium]